MVPDIVFGLMVDYRGAFVALWRNESGEVEWICGDGEAKALFNGQYPPASLPCTGDYESDAAMLWERVRTDHGADVGLIWCAGGYGDPVLQRKHGMVTPTPYDLARLLEEDLAEPSD